MPDPDSQIDDALRQVRVPPDLSGRVAPEALFADAALDRLLGDVSLPAGLAERVLANALATRGKRAGGVVDLSRPAVAAAAPTPTAPRRRRGPAARMAREVGNVAAALGLAGLLAVAGIEFSQRLEGPARGRAGVAARPQTAARAVSPALGRGAQGEPPERADARPSPPDDLPPGGKQIANHGPADDAGERRLEVATAAAPQPAEQTVRGAPTWSIEQSSPAALVTLPLPESARRPVPRSAAFDLAFEMAHGEAPFVDPSARAELAVDTPPLTLRTDGFDTLLEGWPGRRVGGSRGRIRAEEVLAAVPPPPELAAPGGESVRLLVHGVPSGRSVAGVPTVLLEAVVHAAGDAPPFREPLRTTVVVDQSAAGQAGAWSKICRGLVAVAGQLGPADTTTVILAGPRPRVALRDADPTALNAAASTWESLPAAASSDLDAALELAAAEGLLDRRTIVVAHAVTLDRGRAPVREALREWQRSLATAGGDPLVGTAAGSPRFIVIDPAAPTPDRQGEPTFGRTSLDALAIRRDLVRQVTGRDTLVARHCRLELKFDPARVARYRIIGHRQTAVESLSATAAAAIDLHAGETARVVYEVVPRQPDTGGLATATFTWRRPEGGAGTLEAGDHERHERGGSLPSPHGCELLLAAGIGELAAASPHVAQPRDLLAALAEVAAGWRARGDVTAFGAALIDILDRGTADQRTKR